MNDLSVFYTQTNSFSSFTIFSRPKNTSTNSYVTSLKLENHLILTIPSSTTLPGSLQQAEKLFKEISFANQLSSFHNSRKIAESTKTKRKS